jgi:hypothetical protein
MPIKPKSFFHPVLSKFSTDYKPEAIFNVDLLPHIVEDEARNQILIEYIVELTSSALRDFIIDKRAVIAFDVYCGDTMFRALYKVSELSGEITLPPASVKGQLEIQPIILVADNSSPFILEQINDEYPTNKYDLEIGAPLALSPSITIPIEFALSSIKEMVKIKLDRSRAKNTYFIDATPEQIVVHMGVNAHAAFHSIADDPNQKAVLFFSVYKDCIAYVLEQLSKNANDVEYRWAEHFLEQLEKRNIKLPGADATYNEINLTALEILGPRGFEKVVSNAN